MKSHYSLRHSLLALIAFGAVVPVFADDYFDDIYFDPKKPAKSQTTTKKSSAYIADFDQMDVDAYNRRGQYYISPVDTIGIRTENAEDFVYTQQIQKYYNPRIIVDNAATLQDILDNSYGNVEIVYNAYGPAFAGWGWSDLYYNPFWGPTWMSWNDWKWAMMSGPNLSWTWNWGWGPSLSWSWGPTWSWGWGYGPSWGYGPGWGWGYGPGWGYPGGIGWGPAYPPARPLANYRPNGRRPNNPGTHWATTRPGAAGGNYVAGRPGGSHSQVSQRPGGNAGHMNGNVANQTPVGNTTRPGRYTFGGANASAAATGTPTRNESTATSTARGSRGQGTASSGRVTTGSSNLSTSRNSSSSSSSRYNSNSSSSGSSSRYNSNSSNSSSTGRYSNSSNSSSSSRYSTGSSSSGRYSSGSAGRSSSGGASRGGGGGRGSRR